MSITSQESQTSPCSDSQGQGRVVAAIDVGSNTIHIVVARVYVHTLDILADEVEMVRIGESVTANGTISAEKRDLALNTLRQYKSLAERYSASPVLVVATEAIRQARNSAEFVEDVQRETGLEMHIVPGDVEATLTFAGATYELLQQPGVPAHIGVMDLGGGSMELVMATHQPGNTKHPVSQLQITWRTSVPIGSGWIHDRYMPSNPPTDDEVGTASTFLATSLKGMPLKHRPPVLTVTGGSANSLLYLSQQAFRRSEGEQVMTREDIVRCEGLLLALSAEEIASRYGQPVARARVLPAGTLVIHEVMNALHLEHIQVSPHGIREGVLLAYAQYGEQWLEQVNGKTTGDERHEDGERGEQVDEPDMAHEAFVETGRRLLSERTQTLLEWRDDVVKGNDSEAVHKMRVASRRLRAVLDAYEPICDPRSFQLVYRQVKKMANVLGEVRDTDVMMQRLREMVEQTTPEEQEGTQWLLKRLRHYRQQQQHRLKAFFKKFDEHAFLAQVEACLSPETEKE